MDEIKIGDWVMSKAYYNSTVMYVVDVTEEGKKIGCRYLLNGKYILEYFFAHELQQAEIEKVHKFQINNWVVADNFSLSPVMLVVKLNQSCDNFSVTCRYLKEGIFHAVDFMEEELRMATEREALFHSPRKKTIGISPL